MQHARRTRGKWSDLMWLKKFYTASCLVWLVRLKERLEWLAHRQRIDWVEVVNVGFALCWLVPMIQRPDYLKSSPYLRQIDEAFGRTGCIVGALFLFSFWLGLLLFGSNPSGFITSDGRLRTAIRLRTAGFFVAIVVWRTVGSMLANSGLNAMTCLAYGVCLACAWGIYQLHRDVCIERLKRLYQSGVSTREARAKWPKAGML